MYRSLFPQQFFLIPLGLLLTIYLVLSPPTWAGPPGWTSAGPEGGYVNGVTFDPASPNILYASLNGGIYKSTDGGGNWSSQGLNGQSVGPLVVDPVDHNVLYALPYYGVSKSTDGGNNWNQIPSNRRFYSLLVDPAHHSTLYAGLECGNRGSGCMAKSTDGGSNWTLLMRNSPGVSILALALDPQNPQVMYAGGFYTYKSPSYSRDNGVYKTTDGGSTWTMTNLTYINVTSLAVDQVNPTTFYAAHELGLFKTTDGGSTWESISAFTGRSVTSIVISPGAPSILFAGTRDGLYKSSNGGNTWISVADSWLNPSITAIGVHPGNPDIVCAGTAGNGFQISKDGGDTWTLANHGLKGSWTLRIAADLRNPSLLYAATQGAGIHKSTSRGASWIPINSGLTSPNVNCLTIDPLDSSIVFAGTSEGVFKTTNSGNLWIASNSGLPNEGIRDLVVDPTDHQSMYAAVNVSSGFHHNSGLYKSNDGGATWGIAGFPDDTVFSVLFFPAEPKTVWASTSRGIFKSHNGGLTWTPVSNAAIASSSTAQLLFHPQTANTIFSLSTVGNVFGVYRSTDGGLHWKVVLTPTVAYSMAISPTDPNLVYAGSSGGVVYKSANGGTTWMTLPMSSIRNSARSLAVDPQYPHTVHVGTESAGVQSLTVIPGTQPILEVTSPNQGERWKTGTTQTITWTSSGVSGPLKIEYTTDGYGYFPIVDSTGNTGSYTWVLPSSTFSRCQVRISALDGSASDNSDVWFSTYQQDDNLPSITFTQPGNDSIVSGTVQVLAGASDDIGVRLVEIFIDGHKVFDRNIPEYGFPWETTAYPNGKHTLLARAYDSANQTVDDWITVTVNNASGVGANTWILPSSARTGGAGNTYWTTDLTVANVGISPASVSIKFLGNNSDGRQGPERSITLAPAQSVTYSDVLRSLFGLNSGFGAIRIIGSTPDITVLSQTSTPGAGGTYGQSVPAQDSSQWVNPRTSRTIDSIRETSLFRTNLILVNTTEIPVMANVTLNAGWYETLGAKSYDLPPLGMIQISRLVRDLGITQEISNARMTLSTSTPGGTFTAYATAIDNSTGDPRTLLPRGAGSWLLPSSARASGVGGTFWTTDLTISNPSQQEARFTLRFQSNQADSPQLPEEPYQLSGGTSISFRDVLNSVFGLASDFGSIILTSDNSELTMVAETSTPGGGGSYGQSVPASASTDLIRAGSEKTILGVAENSKFRANLILSNATNLPITVDATLHAENGTVLGSKQYQLTPFGMTQVNRIVRALGVSNDISGARLVLTTETPKGAFAAYVALIDNGTGDPRTLLAQ